MITFTEFLQATRGETPYPWQKRFAAACVDGRPPAVIATPTGSGKTTVVDAFVWALAAQADRAASDRTVSVRVVWAIDRRILVDEVYERSRTLAARLKQARSEPGDALHEMACRLAALAGTDIPLEVTRWRGGLAGRPILHPPFQPEVITSTVAQIGSRLLFRGYGVGSGSLAVSAALAACDTTVCLDEAHLAEPFRQTVAAIRDHRETTERDLPLPGLRAIVLTATPSAADGPILRLDDDDRRELGARLTGEKTARLVEPESGRDADRVAQLAEAVRQHVAAGAPTVACVVNTVGRARAVYETLVDEALETILLVGPQRPADREKLLHDHRQALFEGAATDKPLVCVATQTFEVGLDADVEAMVTESASAAALVQRLGRLNRRGGTAGRTTIMRDEGRWLYEADEPLAWAWLRSRERSDGTIDVSVSALDGDPDRPAPQRTPLAPELTAETVALLAQTSPRPAVWCDPDVEVFLRGAEAQPASDLAVCWRADLRTDLDGEHAHVYRSELLRLIPPQRRELLALSVWACRALIAARFPRAGQAAPAVRLALGDTDVEGETAEVNVPDPGSETGVPFVVVRDGDVLRGTVDRHIGDDVVQVGDLRAGDVVVLDVRSGGADDFGLAPRASRASDVAGDVRTAVDGEGQASPVRLTRGALRAALGAPPSAAQMARVRSAGRKTERKLEELSDADARDRLTRALAEELDGILEPGRHPGLTALLACRQPVALRSAGRSAGELFLEDVGEVDDLLEADEGMVDPTADEAPPLERAFVLVPLPRSDLEERDRRRPPTLDQHAVAVRDRVEQFAEKAGLPERIRDALLLAARVHDHGKADPRMQAFFRRGAAALGLDPLAKSEFGTRDPRTDRLARRRSGYPVGLRHEIASVAVLTEAVESGRLDVDGLDVELALHLVGTHHGRGRPLPPMPQSGGAAARRFRVDAAGITGEALGDGLDGWQDGAWFSRFWTVVERFGPWGCAYLEALLVSADRAVSSEGS